MCVNVSDVGVITNAVEITDFRVVDARIGGNMSIHFTITLQEELSGDPHLNMTMLTNRGTNVPCIMGLGTWYVYLCTPRGN